jgi:hypothetical protein
MVQSLMVCLSVASVLLLGVVITEIERDGLVIIRSTLAQTTPASSGNMTLT